MFTSIIIINSCLDSGCTLHVSCRTYSLTCLSSAVIVIGVSLILNREEFSSWCVLVEIIDRAIVRGNFQQFRRCKEVLALSRILSGNFTMVGNFEWTLFNVWLLDFASLGFIQMVRQLRVIENYVRLGHHTEFDRGLSF